MFRAQQFDELFITERTISQIHVLIKITESVYVYGFILRNYFNGVFLRY